MHAMSWYYKNSEKAKARARENRKKDPLASVRPRAKRRGISVETYLAMEREQGGVCLICKGNTNRRLAIDHDHETGEVRGLLCGKCNTGIGQFDEDPDRMRAAIAYLEERAVRKAFGF